MKNPFSPLLSNRFVSIGSISGPRIRWGALVLIALFFAAPVFAQQQITVVNYGDVWNFKIPGADPGSGWRGLGFNDADGSWGSGPGLFGFDTAPMPSPGIQTAVGATATPPVTYLFRKTFTFHGDPAGASFAMDQVVDDGVAFYLNGNLIGSLRYAPGGLWNAAAHTAVGDAVEELNILTGAATGLVYGTNVLSAEAHQNGPNGSDMVFGARLKLTASGLGSAPWRNINFGSSTNSGTGADLSDPDQDGLENLTEYVLCTDPNKADKWGTVTVQGSTLSVTYLRRKAALNEVSITALWATDTAGIWSSSGVTEQILSDDGMVQNVRTDVPLSGVKKFVKVEVVRPVAPPVAGIPTDLVAVAVSSTEINLTWTDNSTTETGFKIERRQSGTPNFVEILTTAPNITAYTSAGLTPGTKYYYRLRATNAGGDSAYSLEANATTYSGFPAMPSGLSATAVSSSQINLSWSDDSNNESGFKIERRKTGDANFAVIATTAANATTFQDTGRLPGTKYYYHICATNGVGDSAMTADVNATTLNTAPAIPSGLVATSSSPSQIELSWTDNSSNETEFKIERKTGSGGTYAQLATVGADINSYINSSLAPQMNYYYRVRASNAVGDSGFSNEANATTQDYPAAPSGLTPGANGVVVNNLLYEWIPTKDVTFQVMPDGKVKILAPTTKRSFNNNNDCKRFIYDHAHTRLSTADANALFGSGLALPIGNHGFCILWLNTNTYDDVLAGGWDLTNNPATYLNNSQKVDYFNISIVPNSPTTPPGSSTPEVLIPYDLQRVSWLPHYQLLPHNLNLPASRGFGITRMLMDIPLDQVYQKVTQIQYMYGFLDTVPHAKKWMCMRAYSGQTNAQLIQNSIVDTQFGYLSQMDEDFGNMGDPNHLQRAQQVLEGVYQRLVNEKGVTSPNQTRMYDDYFSDFGGYSNSENFRFGFNATQLVAGLSSQAMARKQSGGTQDCTYFTQGAYNFRNWRVGGYLDSFERIPEGLRVYNEIYNYEKRFMAAPDRKVVKMGWTNSEGVNSAMYAHGTETRLHFAGGDIIRSVEISWPFHMMVNESFWALLLGHDFDLWHSSVPLVSNINNWGDSWAAGAGNTKWQPTGGSIVDYNASNPSHPQRSSNPLGQFPTNPHFSESGAFTGAWLVSQITTASERISNTIEYCPFSYRLNGDAVLTGYYNGNTPANGSLGNAKLSRFGVANYGQANIVKSYEAKKPICIYTSGANGAALIYHNTYCGLSDVNEVTINAPNGTRTFQVTGNSLHVFYLN